LKVKHVSKSLLSAGLCLVTFCSLPQAQAGGSDKLKGLADAGKNAELLKASNDALRHIPSYDKDPKIQARNQARRAVVLYYRATALAGDKKFSEALPDLNKAISINHHDSTYYELRSWVFENMNKPEDAFKDAEQAVKLNPKSALGRNSKATYFKTHGKWKEALAEYNAIIAANPDSLIAHRFKMECLFQLKDWKNGLLCLDAMEKLGEPKPTICEQKATVYAEMDDFKNVKAQLDKAAKLDPSNAKYYDADYHMLVGVTYKKHKNMDKACEEFATAAKLQPQSIGIMKELLDAYRATKNRKKEVETLVLYEALDDKNPQIPYQIAEIYYATSEYEKAVSVLERALMKGSKKPSTYYLLALCQRKTMNDKKALVVANKCIELEQGTSSAYGLWVRAGIEHDKGQEVVAMQDIDAALAKKPTDKKTLGGLYKLRAEVNEKLGKKAEAIEDRKKAAGI
jgi:tetratricopeptide (TPR) repeat protein